MNQSKNIVLNSLTQTQTNNPELSSSGDNAADATNQNAPDAKSPKVQFDPVATTSYYKKRGKRSFKDIVLEEVIGMSSATASARRGILKLRGETSEDSDKQSLSFVNEAYVGDDETGDDVIFSRQTPPTSRPSVSTTARSAFPFQPRKSGDNVLAGVVELLYQRSSLDFGKRDMHPFGRDISVEAMLQGASNPKRQNRHHGYSKLALWLMLFSMLVGAACGIIFLSETYNAKHSHYFPRTTVNETENATS